MPDAHLTMSEKFVIHAGALPASASTAFSGETIGSDKPSHEFEIQTAKHSTKVTSANRPFMTRRLNT